MHDSAAGSGNCAAAAAAAALETNAVCLRISHSKHVMWAKVTEPSAKII